MLRALTMLDRDRRILEQVDSQLWSESLSSPKGKQAIFSNIVVLFQKRKTAALDGSLWEIEVLRCT